MQQNRQTNAKAIASLVLSCASMICCVQWSISLVMAVLGIVFGILGLRDDNPNQEDAAIAGIVVGVAIAASGTDSILFRPIRQDIEMEVSMTDINRHRGLAIASLILGGISCFCCFGTGIGVIPAAIALVFSIIAVAKGGKNAKKLGIIGLILSAIGLVLNAVILAYGIWMIRWDHMTIENLSSIQNLNPANEKDIIEWLQQFIKVDISGMVN